MPKKRIKTSRELAEVAGVSHISVSRAFRGDKGVSEATRQRILQLAKEHGYRPNPIHSLHSIAKGNRPSMDKLGTLAFVHFYPELQSWAERPSLSGYLSGMQAQALNLGFQIEEFAIGKSAYTAKRLERVLDARGITGIIFGPKAPGKKSVSFTWEKYCCVRFTPTEWEPQLHYVADDNLYGLTLILQKLQALGYRRIGYTIPKSLNQVRNFCQEGRILSYNQTIPERDRIPPYFYTTALAKGSLPQILEWLQTYQPDCVICRTNEMKDLLEENGWSVPADIGVVHQGIADDVADWSGYRPDQFGIGAAAVDLVVNRIVRNELGVPASFREVNLRGSWQDGSTTR